MTENVAPLNVIEGDRVLVLRRVFCRRWPGRWEMAVFRDPNHASQLVVKRVVGLPGESIQIRGGDVYVDGRIERKSLDRQREMAVLVHDASRTGSGGKKIEPRWRSDAPDSCWSSEDGRFRHPGANESVDWLVYHHSRRAGSEMVSCPITDELFYNQWRTQRNEEAHSVGDLLLHIRLRRASGDGRLILRAGEGEHTVEASIQPATGRYDLRINGQPVSDIEKTIPEGASGCLSASARMAEITFSLIDQQVLLAVDDQVILCRPLADAERPDLDARPLAIGSVVLNMEIDEVRVYRDIYHARPLGPMARWAMDRPVRLGAEEYFVLGDNSLISEDSRSWPTGPALPESLLIGRPVVIHSP